MSDSLLIIHINYKNGSFITLRKFGGKVSKEIRGNNLNIIKIIWGWDLNIVN